MIPCFNKICSANNESKSVKNIMDDFLTCRSLWKHSDLKCFEQIKKPESFGKSPSRRMFCNHFLRKVLLFFAEGTLWKLRSFSRDDLLVHPNAEQLGMFYLCKNYNVIKRIAS